MKTQAEKIIELILSGEVTGMSYFYKEWDSLKELPHNEVLSKMAKFAVMEAIFLLEEFK